MVDYWRRMINCSIDESFVPDLVIFQFLCKNLLEVWCTWVSGTPSSEGHRGDVIHVKVYGNLKDLHLYQHCSNDRESCIHRHSGAYPHLRLRSGAAQPRCRRL